MTGRRVLFCLIALLAILVRPAGTGADPADDARAAADQLEQASDSLNSADSARDRVRALTETVQAYEAGLEAMRDGLRQAATREAQIARQLQARETEIAQFLGVLQTIETAPPPLLILHPSGPLGSARSAMILAEVAPTVQARAGDLRAELEEMQTLRALREKGAESLADGLAGVQVARAELSKAIADRTDLPRRFTEDPIKRAILLSSAATLDQFAQGLGEIAEGKITGSAADVSGRKGQLPLPVQGLVLHRPGEADAAGIRREGLILATRPRALVTAPAPATIRYLGPLLDLGNVVILEPQPGTLFVFSGLDEVFGETGQVISEGSAVGLMGGDTPQSGAILSLTGDGTGTGRSESLYIEVREGGSPVDPETWFRTDKDG